MRGKCKRRKEIKASQRKKNKEKYSLFLKLQEKRSNEMTRQRG